MTTFYSEHYSADVGDTGHFTTLLSVPKSVTVGKKHARMRRTAAHLTIPLSTDMGSGDIIRLLDMKSGDRLIELLFSMDANFGATTTFDVGLYLKGPANDGAVVDVDLFGSAIDWAGAIARVDYFKEAGTLDDWDRGKTLWELAAIGAGSDTVDPGTTYTIAATTTQDITVTAASPIEFLCEAYYIAGD